MNSIKQVRRNTEHILKDVPIDFGGGCSVSKATVLSYIIKSQMIKKSLDIGIYKGRSFYPQGYSHKKYTDGIVYGVDPYSNEEAMEYDHKELQDEINKFAKSTDFQNIYKTVNKLRTSLGIQDHSIIVRKTANKAVKQFIKDGTTFGLIHVDGNHDTSAVVDDVNNYLPLLDKQNGFMVLDDISWSSVKPAVDLVSSKLTLLYSRVDTKNDYAVFWTGKSPIKKRILRNNIALAAEN